MRVAMGSPLAPVLANIFMGHHEKRWLEKHTSGIEFYRRYVDDSIALFNTEQDALSFYLSKRPQVSMVYRLINQAGCWKNTRRICKSRAAGEWFTNSPSGLLLLYNNSEDTRNFHGFTVKINHSWLTNQSARINLIMVWIYINTYHPNIKFTMEREKNHKLPFLYVLLDNISHRFIRRPTLVL